MNRRSFGELARAGLGALAALALVATLAPRLAAAEPVKIRMHWATTPGHWAPLIPEFPKSVEIHYGKSYVVEPIFIRGSGPAMQALAAGELEVTGLSPEAINIALTEAKLDITVVGQQFSTNVPGWAGSSFWVRKDSGIKKVEDLKGKIIGVNARGATIDAAARTMLLRHGLHDGKDYQIVEVRFPAQLAALKSGRVHLAILLRAWDIQARKDPTLMPLFSMGDAIGPNETITWVAKTDWLKAHRAAVVDMIEDSIRARRWAASKEGHDEAVKIAAKITKRPVKQLTYAWTHQDNYYDPNAMVNVKRLQKNIDDLVKIHLLKHPIDISKHVDLSIAEEAAKRVNKQQM
jgi:ABC-type nitrate/sulfonate/bicarbonate transport system substrate-binding protein